MLLPVEVPVMTLPGAILFPQAMLPLHIFEPRYRRMLRDSLLTHRMFAVAMQRPGCTRESPSAVAGLGLIRAAVTNRDGTSNLVLQGLARVRLIRVVRYRPYRVHRIQPLPQSVGVSLVSQALTVQLLELVHERLSLGWTYPFPANELESPCCTPPGEATEEAPAIKAFRSVLSQLTSAEAPEPLADLVSATMISSPEARQCILETRCIEDRLGLIIRFLSDEIRRRRRRPAP
ncbi:MAG TPA: LON peptidase substrate-binding domain-containing protein [Verrucomicrobiota bacterium]|nr:LON peptidase substrate-binding domain-containing protein [Verrucomicrobiota bacterium]HNU52532.1 LON peptidase substrate-binding domain-containing protein [Verrucomicrobiota bacterium]